MLAPHNAASGAHQAVQTILGKPVDELRQLSGGGNSRLYRVRAGEQCYALKEYPTSVGDLRDRLAVERRALLLLGDDSAAQTPHWYGDFEQFGLLSWIEGVPANPPTDSELEQAIAFLARLRARQATPTAQGMPFAYEAAQSLAAVIMQVQGRLSNLLAVTEHEPMLAEFLHASFCPAHAQALTAARETYAQAGWPIDRGPLAGYALIPGDFGFHNALRGKNRELTFIDFEYFGWDDPVKLTADFLWHPAGRLSAPQSARFAQAMHELFQADVHFAKRCRTLQPLIALRWITIVLNEFLPHRWHARKFARGEEDWTAVKKRQLALAMSMMRRFAQEFAFA